MAWPTLPTAWAAVPCAGFGAEVAATSEPGEEFNAEVQRMLGGDEGAFRKVYRTVQPGLLRY